MDKEPIYGDCIDNRPEQSESRPTDHGDSDDDWTTISDSDPDWETMSEEEEEEDDEEEEEEEEKHDDEDSAEVDSVEIGELRLTSTVSGSDADDEAVETPNLDSGDEYLSSSDSETRHRRYAEIVYEVLRRRKLRLKPAPKNINLTALTKRSFQLSKPSAPELERLLEVKRPRSRLSTPAEVRRSRSRLSIPVEVKSSRSRVCNLCALLWAILIWLRTLPQKLRKMSGRVTPSESAQLYFSRRFTESSKPDSAHVGINIPDSSEDSENILYQMLPGIKKEVVDGVFADYGCHLRKEKFKSLKNNVETPSDLSLSGEKKDGSDFDIEEWDPEPVLRKYYKDDYDYVNFILETYNAINEHGSRFEI